MNTKTLIRIGLVIMGIYTIGDAFVHLFNIRTKDVVGVWPSNALAFSQFLSQIYGSFVLLAALMLLELSRKVEAYKNFVYVVGIWSFFHGVLLATSLITGFFKSFNVPSLYAYIPLPYYIGIEILESVFLVLFAFLVLFWRLKNRH